MLSGRPAQDHLPRVEVHTELDAWQGWAFKVQITRESADDASPPPPPTITLHDVRLGWVDYEYWSHGTVSPSGITQIVLQTALAALPDLYLPPSFDLAACRRWVPTLDQRLADGV